MRVLCALSTVIAFATAGVARAEAVPLSDAELANIAAGFYDTSLANRNTVVTGDRSAAVVRSSSMVALGDNSQRAVRAVGLTNSANSGVANGSNIRDDRRTATQRATATSVDQANRILQEDRITGYAGVWQTAGEDRVARSTENFNTEFAGGIVPHVFTFTGTLTTITRTTHTDSEGNSSTDTNSKTEHPTEALRVGRGVALAGEVDVSVGAGGIIFSETEGHSVRTSSTATFTWSGVIFEVTASESTTVHVTREGGNSGSVQLQPFSLHAKGVICQVIVGSCKPHVGRYSSSSQSEEITRPAALLHDAQAGRIVMSDGQLDEEIDSRVTLEGRAQRDVRALHAANATGSQLANGLNVSRGIAMTTLPSAVRLRQTNEIAQRR